MRLPIFFMISILFFIIGCTTTAGLLRLQDRELLIHPDKPGLAYPHKFTECVDRKKIWRWLGKKCKKKHKIDFYDFTKKKDRMKLINAGFTCKTTNRFRY